MKRRTLGKRKATFQPMASYAYKKPKNIAARVKKLESAIEKKNLDFALKATEATGGYTAVGTVIRLNGIPEGTSPNERIGRRVTLDSIWMRFHVTAEEADGLTGLRTIILFDSDPDGGSLTGQNYLDYSAVINGEEYLAPIRLDRADTVTVLYDDCNGSERNSNYQVNGTGTTTQVHITGQGYRYLGNKDLVSTYGEGSTIPVSGSLVMLLVGNQWASATANPLHRVALTHRLRYKDA